MADDEDFRRGTAGDVAEDILDDHFRRRSELVAVQKEVEEERRGPRRLGAERHREGLPRLRLGRRRGLDGAGPADFRGRVRPVQDPLLIAVRDHERADGTVGAGHKDVEVGARGWWRRGRGRQQYHWCRWWRRRRDDRHLRASREEHHDRNPEDRADHRPGSAPGGAPVRTRNSVPRTPSMAAGVRTFIASGDCFAILPETAASVPRLSDVSNAPLWVVESNANRSMARLLSGPIESRLLSPKVMPTDPSAPVVTTSPSRTFVPTGTGIRCPDRST